jgi:gamma-glutamyltranspeptidase/glutathione hydrolase
MARGNGLITQEDLDSYSAVWRPALEGTYRGHRIITMPPSSAGGVALLQLLNAVEPFKIARMKHNSTDYVHLLVEAERRVYADRAQYLGDPGFVKVPVRGLTDKNYMTTRMGDFNKKKATPSDDISHGQPLMESDETTHFSIIDKDGNAVSVTTTINGSFGNKVVVGNAGFLLNNEMDDFSIKPGVPNMFGLTGSEANAIEPGKRMLSSMTPTIVEKNGKVLFVTGTPGGSTIITSVFQSILNIIDFEMSALEAVSAPRFHSQWKPDVISIESGAIAEKDSLKLVSRGHSFRKRGLIGAVDAIKVLEDGTLEGGADPRRKDDTAVGY